MADEEEEAVDGGLFEILEQCVGSGAFEIVDRVDDHYPPGRERRRGREETLKAPDLIDADAARQIDAIVPGQPFETHQIGMTARLDQPRDRMVVRNVEAAGAHRRPGTLGQDAQGSLGGEQRLPDPFGTADQPGMVQALIGKAGSKGGDGIVMAVKRSHGRRSASSRISLAVTSSAFPLASTIRKRAGSSSAMARNVDATSA